MKNLLVSNKIKRHSQILNNKRQSKISLKLSLIKNRKKSQQEKQLNKMKRRRHLMNKNKKNLRKHGVNPLKRISIARPLLFKTQWMKSSLRHPVLHQRRLDISRRFGMRHSLMKKTSLSLKWSAGRSKLGLPRRWKRIRNTLTNFRKRFRNGNVDHWLPHHRSSMKRNQVS